MLPASKKCGHSAIVLLVAMAIPCEANQTRNETSLIGEGETPPLISGPCRQAPERIILCNTRTGVLPNFVSPAAIPAKVAISIGESQRQTTLPTNGPQSRSLPHCRCFKFQLLNPRARHARQLQRCDENSRSRPAGGFLPLDSLQERRSLRPVGASDPAACTQALGSLKLFVRNLLRGAFGDGRPG